jgi:cytochrome c biogenesis protein CcmG/thiol:disulfide interchange protein DsbE
MRRSTAAALTVTLSILLSVAAPAADTKTLRVGDPFPSRSLPGLGGTSLTVPDDVNGKVTIVHFWTDWCGSCREEMPALEALYIRYKGRGFQVVAINVGQTKAQVKKFIEDLKLTYAVLLDGAGDAAKDYGVIGLPRTFILDRKGIIRYKILGEADEASLQKLVGGLL